MESLDKKHLLEEIREIRNLVLNSMQQGLLMQQQPNAPPPKRTLFLF
jgi:hypothetical protein